MHAGQLPKFRGCRSFSVVPGSVTEERGKSMGYTRTRARCCTPPRTDLARLILTTGLSPL